MRSGLSCYYSDSLSISAVSTRLVENQRILVEQSSLSQPVIGTIVKFGFATSLTGLHNTKVFVKISPGLFPRISTYYFTTVAFFSVGQSHPMSQRTEAAEPTQQKDVGPGSKTGVYYITVCNVSPTCFSMSSLLTLGFAVAFRNLMAGAQGFHSHCLRR